MEQFFTKKGYDGMHKGLSASMEDYLEMIYRQAKGCGIIRISELAACLHVQPSSASKMVGHLKQAGLLSFRKYGYITLTEKGEHIGSYLLYRHETVLEFLRVLNGTDGELEQTEMIEHYLEPKTVENLEKLTQAIKSKSCHFE